jgi:hypothetical protein
MKKTAQIVVFTAIFSLLGCSLNPPIKKPIEKPVIPYPDSEYQTSTYENKEFGLKFTYPSEWTLDETVGGSPYTDSLDIHINNLTPVSDAPGCQEGYAGLEIQSTQTQPNGYPGFEKFAKETLLCTNPSEQGLGCLSGNIEKITINTLQGYKGTHSGWDGCDGPGYAIEQAKNQYIYIFTGTQKASDDDKKKIDNIVNSITNIDKQVSFCDKSPTTTDIGRNILPIDLKYKHLGFLGQLFTAYTCGKERVSQVFGVEEDSYTLGSTIFLKGQPNKALIDTYLSIGFNCYEVSSGAPCKSDIGDKKIELSKTVKVTDLMKLEPYYEFFKPDDCVNCG